MKKLIVLSIIMAVMVLVAALVHTQAPANDLKPTFISPTPGLYVHGWPPFTVSYPKEWVEWPGPGPATAFYAGAVRPDSPPSPVLSIIAIPSVITIEEQAKEFMAPYPLDEQAKPLMALYANLGTDIKVLYDKPSRLKDGTPAREEEIEYVEKNGGRKMNDFWLMTKKGLAVVAIHLGDDKGRIGEDLKKIAYSLTFQPDREEPVQVSPDVRAFLDMYCVDLMGHDLKTIMAHFSDRFVWSGASKAVVEQMLRNDPAGPIQRGVISCEATVTVFKAQGDRVYLDGFFLQKTKGDANAVKIPIFFLQIINEHGQWKWYGNQK